MNSEEFKALKVGDLVTSGTENPNCKVVMLGSQRDIPQAVVQEPGGYLRIIFAGACRDWDVVTPFFEIGKKYVSKSYNSSIVYHVVGVDEFDGTMVAILKSGYQRGPVVYDAVTAEDFEAMKEIQ